MSHRTRRVLSFASGSETAHNGSNGNLPMLSRPLTARNNIVAALGEFVGTFLFLFFSFAGTQVANTPPPTAPSGSDTPLPNTSNLMFIALAFGLSLMANVWAFYRVTGGLFNPVVALALLLVGGLSAIRFLFVVIAQFLGGIAAAAVVSALFPGPMAVATTLGGGASISQGLFIEMFLTAQLVFVIIMLAAEKHKSTFLAPIGIGITFFLAELVGVYFTGPVLGSLLACGFYVILKYLRWRECNPGQDWDEIEKLESQQTKSQQPRRGCKADFRLASLGVVFGLSFLGTAGAGSVTWGGEEDVVLLLVVVTEDVDVEVVDVLVGSPPGGVVVLVVLNSSEEPHQKNWEQQGPKLGLPMQMVLLPHLPSSVTSRAPVGDGMVLDVDVTGGCVAELLEVVDGGSSDVLGALDVLVLVLVLAGGVDDVEATGGSRGHPQVP
ncbi:hypothetical protein VTI28DRAFT_6982 [Corynascus sepedonium]